jgi:nucleoside triphosphate pyrophosphatase
MHTRELSLILASGSPQRQRLLEEAGYRFTVIVPGEHVETVPQTHDTARELVTRLAREKALNVISQLDTGRFARGPLVVVVACDTLAECEGTILGKPQNLNDARRMLELLSGKRHKVYSGLCIWPIGNIEPRLGLATTSLRMDQLDGPQMDEYLSSGQWRGKAGAFGYQDRVGWLHIEHGSESNVIGLPLELFAEMLQAVQDKPIPKV